MSGNGLGEHPLDKWTEWIITKHQQLVNYMIDDVKTLNLEGIDLAEAYLCAGRAMIFAGAQLVFDTNTGAIYGDDDDEPYKVGHVLHNLSTARERCHDWVDHLFDQYTEEYKTSILKKEDAEDTVDEEDESSTEGGEFGPDDADPDEELI